MGIWTTLKSIGSWGTGLVKEAVRGLRSIAETMEILKPLIPDVPVSEVAPYYGKVKVAEALKGPVFDLNPRTVVPESLYGTLPDWFERPLMVTFELSGRYLKGVVRKGVAVGGRFAHETLELTFNRQMTKAEAEAAARLQVGEEGSDPIMEIMSIKAVAFDAREDFWE